jgi:hypothetical protein
MFIEALRRAKLWKQPWCPTTDEWIKKYIYSYFCTNICIYIHIFIHAMKYYSVIKKNEMLSFAEKWMVPEIIMLNEKSQAQKAKSCMFSLICGT